MLLFWRGGGWGGGGGGGDGMPQEARVNADQSTMSADCFFSFGGGGGGESSYSKTHGIMLIWVVYSPQCCDDSCYCLGRYLLDAAIINSWMCIPH